MHTELLADHHEASHPTPVVYGRRRQDALGHFARRVSHDLNNFATVMRTYGELLLADLPPGSSAHADVSEIHRASEAMVAYLCRIAQFARASDAETRAVDADALAHAAVLALDDDQVTRATIPVHIRGTTGARVQVNGAFFIDVVVELLRNAMEASPLGHAVTLTTSLRGTGSSGDATAAIFEPQLLVLTVADDGPGFAPSVSSNAEDPFVTTKHGVRGAGFGLALASAFARESRGRLERTRVDGRTLVSLVLPTL